MNEQQLKMILEGALLAAGRPLTVDDLLGLFEEAERPERDAMHAALNGLAQDYNERGIELREVASGFRVQVKRELSPWISRLWLERPSRYSRALLETMALVAYRQPITRGEIEDIRGVSVSSSIMKTLQEREWIRVVGHRDVPGKPAMYGTTKQFLDYFDLKSLDELPTLAELRDIDSINAELDLREPVPGDAAVEIQQASAEFESDESAGEAADQAGDEIATAVHDDETAATDEPVAGTGEARHEEAAADETQTEREGLDDDTDNAATVTAEDEPEHRDVRNEDAEDDAAAQRWRENG